MKHIFLNISIYSLLILLGFLMATHPFEIPDEQSHFASVQFLVNQKRMPTMNDKKNLSIEEQKAEEILGVMSLGQNKYSRHPEYRMEYVPGFQGLFESDLANLNTPSNRNTYTIHQAALYPPLYYLFASIFYRIAYSSDIITRIFTTRIASIILASIIPLLTYLLGLRIWQKKSNAIILAALSILFPMSSYLGAGINSDNLHNLLFTAAIILAVDLINKGWSTNRSLMIGSVIGIDLITKPQGYILIPIFGIAVLIRWEWQEWRLWIKHLVYIVAPILLFAGWQELPKFLFGSDSQGATAYMARSINYSGADNFATFVRGYIITTTKEMVVWYWGVFKWFGVILPKPFWWIANRVIAVSGIGIILKLAKDIRAKKLSRTGKIIIFSLISNIIYASALFWFDWQFFQEYGRSLGLQARYYLPLLSLQLALIYMGLLELAWTKKLKKMVGIMLVVGFLILHIAGLYTQLKSYYDLVPLSLLIQEISQYKPFFAKDNWWYLWSTLYLFGLTGWFKLALLSKHSE